MAVEQRRSNAPQQNAPLAVLPRQEAPIARSPEAAAMALERVVTMGDLAMLQPEERVAYYLDTCQSLGLNPRSRPFDWLLLDDRVVLYPNKSCADQLRAIHRIRIECSMPEASPDGSMLRCVAKGIMPDGRYDTATKFVPLTGRRRDGTTYRLSGKDLANAYMKAETGAKRRVTFSLIGMAAPPQELDDVEYKVLTVDGRGNIIDNPTPEQKMLAENPVAARVIGEPTFEDSPAQPTVYEGAPVQRPRAEDLEREARPVGPPPSFRCDKARWSRVWATFPNNVLLNDEPARRRYIASYTSTWPAAAQTDSLSRLLDIVTDVQAQRFMDDAREWLAEKAAADAADPDGELDGVDGLTPEQADDEAAMQRGDRARSYEQLFPDDEIAAGPPKMTPEGHAAAVLTGAPITPKAEEVSTGPERLDPDREYGRAELFELYDRWAARMQGLDRLWKPDNVRRLADQALRKAVEDLSAQVTDLEDHLSGFGGDEDDERQGD